MKRPSFTPAQRLRCFAAHGAIVLCQSEGCDSAIYISEAEIDHVQALIDGGEHADSNFRPICSSCHRKKSAFEHRRNSKSKRIAAAQAVHKAVVAKVMTREPSRLRSKGFDKTRSRRFDGKVVDRV